MREFRRKSIDGQMQEYMLKARQEGIDLSWDIYAAMQPQDGVDCLWLTCSDCLQGPCSLGPMHPVPERTICGLSRRDLVYRGIYRFIARYCDPAWEADGLICGCEDMTGLLNIAQSQVKKLRIAGGYKHQHEQSVDVGLGVLDPEYINICLEGVSPLILKTIYALSRELESEATGRGAKGFKIMVIGDVALEYLLPSACNLGGAEGAVLTGLVDLYLIGTEGLGHGRNTAAHYHTVVGEAGPSTCRHKIKRWLAEAAEAFAERDQSRIKPSTQRRKIPVYPLDFSVVKGQINKGYIAGICILGGGNTVKATQDKLLSEAAVRIGSKDILCLTYGNSAVTLGKYGYLEEREELANHTALSPVHTNDALAYCIGSERDVAALADMIQLFGPNVKVVALYPELATPWDLLAVLALAGAGARVITTTRLPLLGSGDVAAEFEKLITYCQPAEFTDYALNAFGRG